MILIAHRGNIEGKQLGYENNPNYINDALNENYDVEIDVSLVGGEFYLGHDMAQYKINIEYLIY